jgi:two-component system OmpR family sensor kinase
VDRASTASPSTSKAAGDEIARLAAALAAVRDRIAADLAAQSAPLPPPTQAEQRQEDFLVTVGEELRTPLEEIGELAALLVAGGRLEAAQAEDVALIIAGSGELLGLVEMVLAPREVEGPLRVQGVDLAALARDVIKAQRPIATEKRLALMVEGEDEVLARGDVRRLRQVLTNLVSNALKFTKEGRVTVSVRRDGAEAELIVRDDGVGIAEGDLSRLFHAYAQVGGNRTRARGTGLGLLICKQIVEAHDGKITVESAVGRGSVFRVRLPAWTQPFAPPVSPPSASGSVAAESTATEGG